MNNIFSNTINVSRLSTQGIKHTALVSIFLSLTILMGGCAAPGGQPVRAFLPMQQTVPATESSSIDGVWRVSTLGKNIRIDRGRAYAIDSWMHLGTLQIMPDMVVIKDIQDDGMGGFSGYDLPLMGGWKATLAHDGALDVTVTGALMPVSYRLLPVSEDYPEDDDDFTPPGFDDDGEDHDQPDFRPPFPPGFPIKDDPVIKLGMTAAEVGKNCYNKFKPMGKAMLEYGACQAGLRNFNLIKKAVTARNTEDAKQIFAAAACAPELNNLVYILRQKSFKSISLGVSGEVAAIIGATGEAFVATNLDLNQPTFYGSVGGSLGTQGGLSANGVVSAYYDDADKLDGKGKSFSVSLKAMGGAGGSVGLSSGKPYDCTSFSASAGAGAAVNAGSVSASRTFKLAKLSFIHKPDFSKGCKNVTVKATNKTGREIKIVDVDFYDYVNDRWRSKVIKNTKVAKGRSWSKKLRLQKVGGDKTRVKVQYKIKKKGWGWSKVKSKETQPKVCSEGMRFTTSLL